MEQIISKTGMILRYTLGISFVLLGFIAHWALYILPTMQY